MTTPHPSPLPGDVPHREIFPTPIAPIEALGPGHAAEPQGPSDRELSDAYWAGVHANRESENRVPDHHAGLRAVLAHCATPRPIPVTEWLPGADDCDAEGRCWFYTYDLSWMLEDRTYGINAGRSHWLPAQALPLPEAEG